VTEAAPPPIRGAGSRAWASARSVLAVRLDSIGDVLMTTPAIRALGSVDGTRITLLTSPAGAAVASLIPEVDDVLEYEAPWMKHSRRADPGIDLAMADALAARRFDAAVIFTAFTQSPLPAAMLCHLARIPLRAAHCRENPYQLLTDWIRETEPVDGVRHEVRRQLDLSAALGRRAGDERLSLAVPDGARARVGPVLAAEGFGIGGAWVVVHPGGTAPSRRYPPELFAAAARSLVEYGFRVVFTGTASEREDVERIRRGMGTTSWSLAGRLGLPELAALIEAAPVFLTNNSGPAHIAAAVGTPVVDLYALTNPQHAPWSVPSRLLFHDVPCRNCFSSVCPEGHQLCLRGVEPSAVASAVLELYEETRKGSSSAAAGRGRPDPPDLAGVGRLPPAGS
jgi:lipopolysaccharide heptosyltransferase II